MELVKVENPMDVYVVASRPQAQRAVLKFARSTIMFSLIFPALLRTGSKCNIMC